MRARRSPVRLLSSLLIAIGLGGAGGCLHCAHPVEKPAKPVAEQCGEVPASCRKQVYVFFLNGLDPLGFANLSGVHDYVRCLGFPKTYYGQCYHSWYFESEIRRLHKEDPEARFVLVGFDVGANAARSVADGVAAKDITIDLLVYLGGCTLERASSRPANVLQLVNVSSSGIQRLASSPIDGAEHVAVPDACHYGSPTSTTTLAMMTQELTTVAARVPVKALDVQPELAPVQTAPIPEEVAPTPRPVKPPEKAERDEWDFLKPAERLQAKRR